MQKKMKARIDECNWLRCGNCSHKLGAIIKYENGTTIEIKCHSCKAINEWKTNKGEK